MAPHDARAGPPLSSGLSFSPSAAVACLSSETSHQSTFDVMRGINRPINTSGLVSPIFDEGSLTRTFHSLVLVSPALVDSATPAVRLEDFLAQGFKSSALLGITGDLERSNPKGIRIDGSAPVYLTRRQFIVLLILVWYSRYRASLPPARRASFSPFLKASQILDKIEELKGLYAADLPAFASGDSMAVTRVIAAIRRRLRRARLSSQLIETGPSHVGYRLSVPPANVVIQFTPPEAPSPHAALIAP